LENNLGLNDDELRLAEIIVFFHDIGRFEQYKHYKTFSDHRSENHAELGIIVLIKYNVLGIPEEEIQKLIFCSIKKHDPSESPSNRALLKQKRIYTRSF